MIIKIKYGLLYFADLTASLVSFMIYYWLARPSIAYPVQNAEDITLCSFITWKIPNLVMNQMRIVGCTKSDERISMNSANIMCLNIGML